MNAADLGDLIILLEKLEKKLAAAEETATEYATRDLELRRARWGDESVDGAGTYPYIAGWLTSACNDAAGDLRQILSMLKHNTSKVARRRRRVQTP